MVRLNIKLQKISERRIAMLAELFQGLLASLMEMFQGGILDVVNQIIQNLLGGIGT